MNEILENAVEVDINENDGENNGTYFIVVLELDYEESGYSDDGSPRFSDGAEKAIIGIATSHVNASEIISQSHSQVLSEAGFIPVRFPWVVSEDGLRFITEVDGNVEGTCFTNTLTWYVVAVPINELVDVEL